MGPHALLLQPADVDTDFGNGFDWVVEQWAYMVQYTGAPGPFIATTSIRCGAPKVTTTARPVR